MKFMREIAPQEKALPQMSDEELRQELETLVKGKEPDPKWLEDAEQAAEREQ
jgi:hypothetical protein